MSRAAARGREIRAGSTGGSWAADLGNQAAPSRGCRATRKDRTERRTMNDPDFTLSAGPVTASARTLAALGSPITYHYDPAFLDCFRRTERKVAQVLQTSADVVLMQGEAVLGLEAAARALVRPGTPVLNLVSGIFGKGMGFWLRDFGAQLQELEVPYDDAVDPDAVERYLDAHPEIELVAVVHCETPS